MLEYRVASFRSLMDRTPASEAGNMGSIPIGNTKR